MIPHYEGTIPKPGSGNGIIFREAYLNEPDLRQLQFFWKEIIECVSAKEVPDWQVFLDTIGGWADPFRRQSPPEQARALMTSFAKEMALDVKDAASNHRGVLRSPKSLMQRSYPELDFIEDNVLDTLYPIETLESDWQTQEERWTHAADKLASSWINREPHEIIAELDSVELEINQQWPRLMPYLCQRLAEKIPDPLLWFYAMLPRTLPADIVMPFLQDSIAREVAGWEQALRIGFETERLRQRATPLILTRDNVPDDVIQAVLNIAGQYASIMERLIWSNQLSREPVIKLFKHPDKSLVGKLLIAEWQRKETGTIADDIRPLWEQAVIEHCVGDYWLREIFKVEADLGLRWFNQRFVEDSFNPSYEFRSRIREVFAEWSLEDRQNLLDIVPDGYSYNDIIVETVGDNLELYERLLKKSNWPEEALLAPLHRSIDSASAWVSFAKLAYEHGHTREAIVEHTLMAVGITASWVGKCSDVWKKRCYQFEALRDHEDEIIRALAGLGYRRSDEQYKKELDKERDEDVYGRDWN